MVKYQDLFNRVLFFSLFILATLSFIVTIQGDNAAPQPLGADPRVGKLLSELGTTSNTSENTSKTQYGNFINEQPQTGFGSIVLFGIVAVAKSVSTIITTLFIVIIQLPLIILGIDQTIINIITTWMLISIAIGLWLLVKLGG